MSYLVTLIAIFTTCCSGWDDKQRIYGTDGTESVIQVESIDEFATEFRSLGQEATLANEAINAIQFTAGQYASSQRLQVRLVDGSFRRERLITSKVPRVRSPRSMLVFKWMGGPPKRLGSV